MGQPEAHGRSDSGPYLIKTKYLVTVAGYRIKNLYNPTQPKVSDKKNKKIKNWFSLGEHVKTKDLIRIKH